MVTDMYRIYANSELISECEKLEEALQRFLSVTKQEAYRKCHIRVMRGDTQVQEAYPAISGWQAKEV